MSLKQRSPGKTEPKKQQKSEFMMFQKVVMDKFDALEKQISERKSEERKVKNKMKTSTSTKEDEIEIASENEDVIIEEEIEEDEQPGTSSQGAWSEAVKKNLKVTKRANITDIVKMVLKEVGTAKQSTGQNNPEDRDQSIIIHRAEESKSSSQEGRRQEDKDMFITLCNDVLDIQEIEIKKNFRLGGRPEEGKCRPLKVVLSSREDKTTFMKSLGRLRDAGEPYNNLSITNDLTRDEREENRKRVAEAKQKTEEDDEFVWKVRGPP
jgi:hypothetical protein